MIPGDYGLYIVIDQFDLNEHIIPGLDHVFILDAGDSSCIYLILRESGCPRCFKLITSFHSLFLYGYIKWRGAGELYLTDLRQSAYSFLQKIVESSVWYSSLRVEGTTRGNATGYALDISKFWVMLEKWSNCRKSIEPYLWICVNADVSPFPDNDKLMDVRIEASTWERLSWLHNYITEEMKLERYAFQPSSTDFYAEWSIHDYVIKGIRPSSFVRWERLLWRLKVLYRLKFVFLVDETSILERGADDKWEDHCLAFPHWPTEIVDNLAIDGSTYQVHIA
jgi:hypothetical protein